MKNYQGIREENKMVISVQKSKLPVRRRPLKRSQSDSALSKSQPNELCDLLNLLVETRFSLKMNKLIRAYLIAERGYQLAKTFQHQDLASKFETLYITVAIALITLYHRICECQMSRVPFYWIESFLNEERLQIKKNIELWQEFRKSGVAWYILAVHQKDTVQQSYFLEKAILLLGKSRHPCSQNLLVKATEIKQEQKIKSAYRNRGSFDFSSPDTSATVIFSERTFKT